MADETIVLPLQTTLDVDTILHTYNHFDGDCKHICLDIDWSHPVVASRINQHANKLKCFSITNQSILSANDTLMHLAYLSTRRASNPNAGVYKDVVAARRQQENIRKAISALGSPTVTHGDPR